MAGSKKSSRAELSSEGEGKDPFADEEEEKEERKDGKIKKSGSNSSDDNPEVQWSMLAPVPGSARALKMQNSVPYVIKKQGSGLGPIGSNLSRLEDSNLSKQEKSRKMRHRAVCNKLKASC